MSWIFGEPFVLLLVLFGFSLSPYMETSLMHWAHRIEDTNALYIARDHYLFGSLNVQIQYSQ